MTAEIPSCFDNYIGIIGGCPDEYGNPTPAPTSGYYISSLEGIDLQLAANIVKSEDRSGVRFLQRKIAFGIQKTLTDLQTMLLPYMRISTALDGIKEGDWGLTYLPITDISPDPLYRGIRIRRIHKSPMTEVYISRVSILIDFTGTVSIWINDGTDWVEYQADVVAQEITTIDIDYRAKHDDIYLLMDNNGISVNEGRMDGFDCRWECSTCGGGYKRGIPYNMYVTGWDGSHTTSRGYGLQVEASVECNMNSLYCMLSKHLGRIALYRIGLEILHEQTASRQLNVFTIYDQDEIERIKERWEEEYKSQYNTLAISIQHLVNNYDRNCVICTSRQYTYGT